MNTIWKYELDAKAVQTLALPRGYRILSVQVQNGKPTLWALVPKDTQYREAVRLEIYGTGQDVPNHVGEHLGTYQLLNGALVFHVFKGE